jgi:hypothetical protein
MCCHVVWRVSKRRSPASSARGAARHTDAPPIALVPPSLFPHGKPRPGIRHLPGLAPAALTQEVVEGSVLCATSFSRFTLKFLNPSAACVAQPLRGTHVERHHSPPFTTPTLPFHSAVPTRNRMAGWRPRTGPHAPGAHTTTAAPPPPHRLWRIVGCTRDRGERLKAGLQHGLVPLEAAARGLPREEGRHMESSRAGTVDTSHAGRAPPSRIPPLPMQQTPFLP